MIRAVLDTNVLLSALIGKKSRAPSEIYKAFIDKEFLLITSSSILNEFEDVINREKIIKLHGLPPRKRKGIIRELLTLSYITLDKTPTERAIVKNDPEDDKLFHAAIEGDAEYIVSGDNDVKNIKTYKGVKIIEPSKFVKLLSTIQK